MVFISPTKNMIPRRLELGMSLPQFCVRAEALLDILKEYNDEDIMNIMKVNARLAVENQKRFQEIHFDMNGTHALSSYDGLAFKYMHLDTWTKKDILYANEHLRILSGFYGVVRPLDSIYPYRLEMQARNLNEYYDNLYSYWSDTPMSSLRADNPDKCYINLASKEYSQVITPYLRDDEIIINIHFQVVKNGKRVILATAAKMARGEMVAYIIKNQIEEAKALKQFHCSGWQFDQEASSNTEYYFIKA